MRALRDLRPCDSCGQPHRNGMFYVLRYSLAVVNVNAVNEFAGMDRFFGGRASFALVENFTPSANQAIRVAMDDPETKQLMTELVICMECYLKPLDLPMLAEQRNAALAKAEER